MRMPKIMVVEDNPDDVRLMKEGMRMIKFEHEMEVAPDVDAALAMLSEKEKNPEASYPDLIILDLKLPRREGTELLAEIKKHSEMKRIPVAVYTTSKSEIDITRCYDHHANCYITKPAGYQELLKALDQIKRFWFEVVTLPRVKA